MTRGDHAVADGQVPHHADLSGQDATSSDPGASAQSDLRAEQGIFADDRGVAHLDQVIDFGAALDAGLTDGSAVDGGVCPDFDVVFDNHDAGLDDLVPVVAVLLRITEAVGRDADAVLQDHVVSNFGKFANRHVRVCAEIVANPATFADERDAEGPKVARSPMIASSSMTT